MATTQFNANQLGPNTPIFRQDYTSAAAQTNFVTVQSFASATLYVYVGGSLLALTSDYTLSGSNTVILNTALAAGVLVSIVIETMTILGAASSAARNTDVSLFGDGSSGTVILTATTTMAAGSGSYLQYQNLTINSGVVLTSAGDRLVIRVQGILTINGSIDMSAKGAAGGAGGSSNGPGGTGQPGSDEYGVASTGGGGGGGGDPLDTSGSGTGGGGAFPFGTGGAGAPLATYPAGAGVSRGTVESMLLGIGAGPTYFTGSGGGGSGSRPSVPVGGPGGAGGGCIVILANQIVFGTGGGIYANGQQGPAIGYGNGGGGSGGYIYIGYKNPNITGGTILSTGAWTGGGVAVPNGLIVDGVPQGAYMPGPGSSGIIREEQL